MNSRNEIILKVENPSPGGVRYSALVRGKAEAPGLEALTVYPEKSFYATDRNELILYNHFGCYSFDTENRIWSLNRFIPSISDNIPISPLSLRPMVFSPDGRFVLYVREEGDVCSLQLYDRDHNSTLLITDRLSKEYSHTLAKWSPDSKYFIYRRGRELYYFSIDQYLSERIPAESFRYTGFSDIQSIQWVQGNYLYVLKDSLVYRIHSSEFFTRSFYSEPFRKGVVWGRISIPFNPAFDRFSIDKKGQNLFIQKNGQGGMVFPLQSQLNSKGFIDQTPILNSSEFSKILDYQWLNDGTLIVLVQNTKLKTSVLFVYRKTLGTGFTQMISGTIEGLTVDDEALQFALFRPGAVDVYDAKSLTVNNSIPLNHTLDFYWGKTEYIAVGQNRIMTVDKETGNQNIAGLCQIEKAGFSPGGMLLGLSGGQWYEYGEALNWIPSNRGEIRPPRLGTDDYRIFLEKIRGQWYDSTLKIRKVDGFDTRDFIPLYNHLETPSLPMLLTADSRANPWYFDHGDRNENKEVSLVFNAIDTAEGVRDVLDILDRYQIHGTFFLNGDFIHANPLETSLIASSENTVGSLFYTWFDMSDPAYHIDRTFLKKGLARNEDDYFIATGHEMAMLWHAPYYYINSKILETSESMEYIYVGTDLKIQDRVSNSIWADTFISDAPSLGRKLLERAGPGSVIPITLGMVPGQEEYLFQVLPMVIEDLLSRGYSFVPLEDMINSSP